MTPLEEIRQLYYQTTKRTIQRDLVRSWPTPLDHTALADARRRLAAEAAKLVGRDAETTTAVDCRYAGQSHELTVGSVAAFHDAHQPRNLFVVQTKRRAIVAVQLQP